MTQIVYQFVATGQDQVLALFRAIPKAAEQSAARVQRAADAQAKAQERAAQKAHQATAKTEDKRWREVEKAGKRIEAEFAREAKAAEKAAAQRERIERRANERIAADRQRLLGKIGGMAGRALLYAGGAAAGAALGTVGAAARDSLRLGEIANRFSINARLAGEHVDAGKAKQMFSDVALAAPGIKSQDVGEAALAYQAKTGKALGTEQLGTLATVASAGGADIKDIAAAAATLREKFGVESVTDMKEAFAALTVQGAKGAFEMKDMASQLETMGAAAQRFGIGKGASGARTLGGLAQMARTSTGSAEEATTSVEAMFRQLTAKSGALKSGQYGAAVSVFDKKGQARDIRDVLVETVAAVGGKDLEKKRAGLQEVFDARGIRAISPLLEAYSKAQAEGTDAVVAMRKVLSDNIDTAANWGSIQDAAAQAQEDASAQMTAAWEVIVGEVGKELAPALKTLVPFLPALGKELGIVASSAAWLAKMFGAAGLQLQEWGLIEGPEATKAIKSRGDLQKFDKEISELEGRSPDTLTETESARLDRMKTMRDTYVSHLPAQEQLERFDKEQSAVYGAPTEANFLRRQELTDAVASEAPGGAKAQEAAEAAEARAKADKAAADASESAAKAAERLALALSRAEDEAARARPLSNRF